MGRLLHQVNHGLADLIWFIYIHQPADRIVDDLWDATGPSTDDRFAIPHGLQINQTKGLVPRGSHKHVATAVKIFEDLLADEPVEFDTLAQFRRYESPAVILITAAARCLAGVLANNVNCKKRI